MNTPPRAASWPDKARALAWLRFMMLFYVFFFPVFFGSARIVEAMGVSRGLYFDWELAVPFVPWMIVPYLTLFSLFLLPLLHMTPREIDRLSVQSTASLGIAFVAFLALAGRNGFVPKPTSGAFGPLFQLIGAVDTPRSMAPSLHVAFAAMILIGCAERASSRLAALYYAWLALLAASTVLIHQHHLLDVGAGFALALSVRKLAPLDGAGAYWRWRPSRRLARPLGEPAASKPEE